MSINKPQLPNVSSPRGAPMGRAEYTEGLDKPVRCFRLKFIDDCYDEGGAYWGSPANVYCAMNADGFQLFCRAPSRHVAKQMFKKRHPAIRWVN